eukprot:TRINITY_DN2299_c0_g1_i1.p2 TRINITY_DN2299_c0_g1~~TRINITY_DN2299_c0_g1_i1.p2  ORF type:complete len:101 (-),score=11.03 TRINITY_DN2299_c0_g1_i1:45-347(-)
MPSLSLSPGFIRSPSTQQLSSASSCCVCVCAGKKNTHTVQCFPVVVCVQGYNTHQPHNCPVLNLLLCAGFKIHTHSCLLELCWKDGEKKKKKKGFMRFSF